jgi:hypothetical protein
VTTRLLPRLLLPLLALPACQFDPRGLSTTDSRLQPRQDALFFPDLPQKNDTLGDTPHDLLQPPDGSVLDTLSPPDADPCSSLSCGSKICCVKNGVLGCYTTIEGCACHPSTDHPCTLSITFKHCCDKGAGFQCTSSTQGCKCDYAAWGAPCGGIFNICCDKGSGATCTNSADGCICVPQTDFPCTTTTFPLCCNKGGTGFVCTDNSGTCICDPVSGEPCGYPYICCDTGGGPMCQTGCP